MESKSKRNNLRKRRSKNIILCSYMCIYYIIIICVCIVYTRSRKRGISCLRFGWSARTIYLYRSTYTGLPPSSHYYTLNARHFLKIHTHILVHEYYATELLPHAVISFYSQSRSYNNSKYTLYIILYYYKVTGVGGQHD